MSNSPLSIGLNYDPQSMSIFDEFLTMLGEQQQEQAPDDEWTLLFWTEEFKLWVKVNYEVKDNLPHICLNIRNECTLTGLAPEVVYRCLTDPNLMQ